MSSVICRSRLKDICRSVYRGWGRQLWTGGTWSKERGERNKMASVWKKQAKTTRFHDMYICCGSKWMPCYGEARHQQEQMKQEQKGHKREWSGKNVRKFNKV